MSDIQNIIKEQFKTLPPIIRDTILNSNWQEKIRRVVKVNNLHIDQGAAIENLVLITMLGIETPEDFVKNAMEYAEVTEEQAYNISAEVEREIFGDIRKKLIDITDVSGTVAEIDQATNELDKVASAIESAAKSQPTPVKPSLKEKIPVNYFEATPSNATIPAEDPYREPPVVEKKTQTPVVTPIVLEPEKVEEPIIKKAPEPIELIIEEPKIEEKLPPKAPTKPIFNPMPKEISVQPTPEIPNTSPSTAKVDPYREPIA